jgi:hypothetical protein
MSTKMTKSEAGKFGALMSAITNAERMVARVALYNSDPTLCLQCDKPVAYTKRSNKFCDRKCSAIYNNTTRHWRYGGNPNPGPKACSSGKPPTFLGKIKCEECGVECNMRYNGRMFCTSRCYHDSRKSSRVKQFEAGLLSSRSAKFVLIELHGPGCMDCGWDKVNPTSGKCPVELEHVDGDSNNNHPSNLKLVCPNCHSLTPTYKALNAGRGRHSRMQRYNKGKSF